jgi:quercetin 2,3-dioxygenase
MIKRYIFILCSILIFEASAQDNKNLKKEKKMKTVVHRSEDRGTADHGWLKARHSFSFAGYYNPAKTHFGTLRVLNDDSIAAGKGFGSHPHDNMEIVTIPLEGNLAHQDNMGNKSVIRKNDVQIMSAGTGVVHSEFNDSKTDYVKLLQIWVFPKVEDIKPRYEQKTYRHEDRKNKFQIVVSPDTADGGVWINQDAWFSLGDFEKGREQSYSIHKPTNGMYIFILEGSAEINGEKLNRRDAMGISNAEKADITILENAEILVIEIPM